MLRQHCCCFFRHKYINETQCQFACCSNESLLPRRIRSERYRVVDISVRATGRRSPFDLTSPVITFAAFREQGKSLSLSLSLGGISEVARERRSAVTSKQRSIQNEGECIEKSREFRQCGFLPLHFVLHFRLGCRPSASPSSPDANRVINPAVPFRVRATPFIRSNYARPQFNSYHSRVARENPRLMRYARDVSL